MYAEFTSALLSYDETIRVTYQGDVPPPEGAVESGALLEARRAVVTSRGQVEILDSEEIARAASIAHQAHTATAWMLQEWPREDDGSLDDFASEVEWRIGGEKITTFNDPEDPLSCFAAQSRLDFVAVVRYELGAVAEESPLEGRCWGNDDFLEAIFGDVQVAPAVRT